MLTACRALRLPGPGACRSAASSAAPGRVSAPTVWPRDAGRGQGGTRTPCAGRRDHAAAALPCAPLLERGARDAPERRRAPDSSVAAVPPRKQPTLPMLARTVMSDSRPATELLYARMMPARPALFFLLYFFFPAPCHCRPATELLYARMMPARPALLVSFSFLWRPVIARPCLVTLAASSLARRPRMACLTACGRHARPLAQAAAWHGCTASEACA